MAGSLVTVCLMCLSVFFYLSADCGMCSEEKAFRPLCSRTCSSSADVRENALVSYKCSCSKSCTAYDDCCYDSPYRDTVKPSEFAFACMSVFGLGDFRAVVSCLPKWRTNSCTELMGYLPPVTSRVTNITYGNVFCASCNEDGDNLIRWNVHLRCPRKDDLQDVGLDFTQIKYRFGRFWGRNERGKTWRSCKFYAHYNNFGILNDLELRHCVIQTKISRCSETWSDLSVKQKCRSYEDPIYIDNTPFRNSHCAECNYKNAGLSRCIPSYIQELLNLEIVDEDYIRSCMAISPYRCVSATGKGKRYRFSFLFDYDHTEPTIIDRYERQCLPPAGRLCCRGERYDDNTNKCRPVKRG